MAGNHRSGRRPAAEETSTANQDYDRERARHEKIKADERELKLSILAGNHLPRDVQRQAAATMLALFAQSARSIPDNLERSLGLAPEVVEAIAAQIDAALAELAGGLKAMTRD